MSDTCAPSATEIDHEVDLGLPTSSVFDAPEEATPSDMEDLLDFLSVAFVEDDFTCIHPRLYRPEHASLNCVVRVNGRIRSSAMLVPHTWHVGEATLRVAGIGGVATHPRYRGRGLMESVMTHQLRRLQEGGFDVAFLAGQRQRYRRFGFEAAGSSVRFFCTRAGMRAEAAKCENHSTQLNFVQVCSRDIAVIEQAMKCHVAQLVRVDRGKDPKEFYLYLKAWRHKPYAAVDEHGRAVGMIVVSGAHNTITELLAETPEMASAMVRAWLARQESVQELQVLVPPTESDMLRRLSTWAERAEVISTECASMFLILQWDRVVDAMLKLRLQILGWLPPGSVVLRIEGFGGIVLCVGREASCSRVEDPGPPHNNEKLACEEILCDSQTATRLLFGPLPPTTVMTLPPVVAGTLSAWCPLPLHWATQDGV
eukprot:TRINITY_DN48587_c0_g1_i1.p1 TRINITY_DN48587_c0_g1~~TRINITY_DN48587_c0_g1_i1.p1  ORF type:complete len:426 (+),score=57.41 TRINITY_DN48587_c0_g1_i1:44-1321(+)